ncbi:MAG: Kdo hydroxylase family protein [Rhodopila sp.]|nr:Kdo hydroxylase family protein [Rhodopila sp.]
MAWPASSTTGCSLTSNGNAVVSLPVQAWSGPFDPSLSRTATTALEAGRVVILPDLAFRTRVEEEKLLSPDLLNGRRKNISFDPATGRLGGSAAQADLLAAMLRRFAADAETLLRGLLTPYTAELRVGRTSFRPAEIAGRTYAPRQDDRRLHVDAFPSRPTGGDRILRLFTNLSPTGQPREWRIGGDFEPVAARFLPDLPSPSPSRARLYALLGLTKGISSPYDQIMLALHNRMKLDTEYQASAPVTAWAFPPGTTWMGFTDQVPHAALAGHMAAEQTFYLPVRAMQDPDRSPLRVLERLTERVLA